MPSARRRSAQLGSGAVCGAAMMTLMACYGGGFEEPRPCNYSAQYDAYNGTCCEEDHYDLNTGRCCEHGVAPAGGCKDQPDPSPYCGDGEVNSSEEDCDDGNNASQDGCSSQCEVELCGTATAAVIGNNSGDTSLGEANFEAPCGAAGTVGAGPETVFSFTPPGPGTLELNLGSLQSHSIYLGYSCGSDQLVGTGMSPVQEEAPSCAASAEVSTSLKVPVKAEPLYIVVDADTSAAATSFTLDLGFVDACGDGTLQKWANEGCDDGNNDAGDGCSSSCSVEHAFYCDAAIEALVGSNLGDTSTGTDVVTGTACAGSEVIYRYTAPEDGTLTVILDSAIDLSLAALATCDSSSLSAATCIDETHADGPEVWAQFMKKDSTRYFVVDSSSVELAGSYDLKLDFVPYD